MLCDSAIAVDMAITSRLNSDRSIPSWPWVTPSHMAGTPPANCAVAPALAAASLINGGKRSKGWCALNMSLYADTIPILSASPPDSAAFSMSLLAAIACATLLHDSLLRVGPSPAALAIRAR